MLKILNRDCQCEITHLFTSVFSLSEGEKEGQLIGALVSELAAQIDKQNIIALGQYDKTLMIGAIFFTRLECHHDIHLYMLSPVAVSTSYQGQGVGQALINHGLDELKTRRVDAVVTYGDPSFYSKLGFQVLSEDVIKAPLTLSMPQGWLGQSLTSAPIPVISTRPSCVEAFNKPELW